MFQTGTATDYRDLLDKLNTFLTGQGVAYGLSYVGTGNGTLTGLAGSIGVAETFNITFTSSTVFSVNGSVSGHFANGAVGTPYSASSLTFLVTAGGTAFVAGDQFHFSCAPPWTSRRAIPGCTLALSAGSGAGGSSGQFSYENLVDGKTAADTTHYWSLGAMPMLLEFNFPAALTIVEYTMLAYTVAAQGPTAWTFEYWNGSAWTTLDTRSSISLNASQKLVCTIGSPVSAARYRLNITAAQASARLSAVELHTSAGGIDQAASQYIWEAPGNDGASAILVGARSFYRTDVSYWDWELFGFDGFDAAQPFRAQAGLSGNLYLPLQNSSTPYWFVADGRRVIVVAKIAGSQYESAYLGFLEPYMTPAQLPYPLAIGGTLALGDTILTWENTAYQASNASLKHRGPVHSDSLNGSTLGYSTMRARRLDGSWAPFFSSFNGGQTTEPAGWIWPLYGGLSNVDVNADGSYTLFPLCLVDSAPNIWGQLSGLTWLTGQGATAEMLVSLAGINHLVIPNINRTTLRDFVAVRLD
jgi:hypothetical protein